MNTSRIPLIAALIAAFAGSALAQTVPAEEWVGIRVPTTANELSREQVAQELLASQAQPQAPAEMWVGTSTANAISASAASRADVMADFALYRQEGLAEVNSDYFNPYGADEQHRLQTYAKLRSGPEFSPDKARLQEVTMAAGVSQQSRSANSE